MDRITPDEMAALSVAQARAELAAAQVQIVKLQIMIAHGMGASDSVLEDGRIQRGADEAKSEGV